MRVGAVVATVLGTCLLLYFLKVQSQLAFSQRISFSAAMVLFYLALGWAWLHPRVLAAPHE
jgi:multisubunit Na+/H+ antiporter MnhB subunit